MSLPSSVVSICPNYYWLTCFNNLTLSLSFSISVPLIQPTMSIFKCLFRTFFLVPYSVSTTRNCITPPASLLHEWTDITFFIGSPYLPSSLAHSFRLLLIFTSIIPLAETFNISYMNSLVSSNSFAVIRSLSVSLPSLSHSS